MKIMNRLYLVENMSFKDLDKINCAVIIATCLTSAVTYAKENWPDIDLVIQELDQSYLENLKRLEEITICVEAINE